MKLVVLIIDGFGIGEMADAPAYNDKGSNSALHVCDAFPEDKWPLFKSFGLGNASLLLNNELPGCKPAAETSASFGVMKEKSKGKDTTTGHWEISGIITEIPFHLFPKEYPSFPDELVKDLEKETGRKILGNKAASGTQIIDELAEEHMKTGSLICYTSADSVFQIAAHIDIIKLEELYKICRTARILCDKYNVSRVIARPFEGSKGKFVRTRDRKDFSAKLPEENCVLIHLQKYGVKTIGVGKIKDIFCNTGIDASYPEKGNNDCLDKTLELIKCNDENNALIFTNLIDTDMLFGHRRDIKGYYEELSNIDSYLNQITSAMKDDDLLIITSDHGNDPGYTGTDHTREHVPLLVYGKKIEPRNLGIRETFADVAQSIAAYFGLPAIKNGKSFL